MAQNGGELLDVVGVEKQAQQGAGLRSRAFILLLWRLEGLAMVKHEPEIRRAKAKLYVESQNRKVHEAPWTTGRFNGVGAGGLYEALELGQLAYKAHRLQYEEGLSKMKEYPPQRFRWVYDETGSADHCVKVLDTETGRLAPWRYF